MVAFLYPVQKRSLCFRLNARRARGRHKVQSQFESVKRLAINSKSHPVHDPAQLAPSPPRSCCCLCPTRKVQKRLFQHGSAYAAPLLLPLFLGENDLSEPVSDFEEAEDAHAGAEAKEAAWQERKKTLEKIQQKWYCKLLEYTYLGSRSVERK